ncbi:hypothetical protein COV24_04755 [candidate division WWE3 bacterium CG10_big_fil_rev_8_21_14_0_10_32_10]|uniref:TrbC/VIRB2 family protein n=1 Tax=candidate division WWE3 bacterium CG10_big_fil_rev_8_21_14_0_10_32_10 TaxID=1975090 RepID=A0A2H0R997_UNCKA|nr:MAG: hypothetical protein COV24_04755 [candidate division WWE3 bacterium CG10_big_fil_rev_8_21_14_0_10_32_10]
MLKKSIIFTFFIALFSISLFSVMPVQANDMLGVEYAGYSGLGKSDVRMVVANIIKIVLGLLGTGALILIIYAGFIWTTSMGNQEKVDKAKKTIWGAVIGLAVILSAYAITNFIIKSFYDASMGGYYG